MELANGIREDWGDDGYVILMSGTPGPEVPGRLVAPERKSACPGFPREGTIEKFKARLGLIVEKESIQGGVYPQLDHLEGHRREVRRLRATAIRGVPRPDLAWSPSRRVPRLRPGGQRGREPLQADAGLVLVQVQEATALELPEKRYEIIRVSSRPRRRCGRRSLIAAMCTTVIQAMTLLRELSDGFQYGEEEAGTETCPLCKGSRTIDAPELVGKIEVTVRERRRSKDAVPRPPDRASGETFTPAGGGRRRTPTRRRAPRHRLPAVRR